VSDTKYVTLDELAAHVGVKVSTVRQWVKRGFVPRETYIKAGNTYRFCVEDVVAALRKEEPTVDLDDPPESEVLPPSGIEDMLAELDDDI
jgi:excisionase family DNA binding protein